MLVSCALNKANLMRAEWRFARTQRIYLLLFISAFVLLMPLSSHAAEARHSSEGSASSQNSDLILVVADASPRVDAPTSTPSQKSMGGSEPKGSYSSNTNNSEVQSTVPDWHKNFLSIITNPTIVYFLLLIGIYGIFIELLHTGVVFPGVIGAISMLLALYALQLLPVSYVGFSLILLGLAFIISEGFMPCYGVLGLGGTASFILGSIMLINPEDKNYQIAWSAIGLMTLINLIIFVFWLGVILKTRNQKPANGLQTLVGAKGRTLGVINLQGQAVIRGEIWSVESKVLIPANKSIKVVDAQGLMLEVKEDNKLDEP